MAFRVSIVLCVLLLAAIAPSAFTGALGTANSSLVHLAPGTPFTFSFDDPRAVLLEAAPSTNVTVSVDAWFLADESGVTTYVSTVVGDGVDREALAPDFFIVSGSSLGVQSFVETPDHTLSPGAGDITLLRALGGQAHVGSGLRGNVTFGPAMHEFLGGGHTDDGSGSPTVSTWTLTSEAPLDLVIETMPLVFVDPYNVPTSGRIAADTLFVGAGADVGSEIHVNATGRLFGMFLNSAGRATYARDDLTAPNGTVQADAHTYVLTNADPGDWTFHAKSAGLYQATYVLAVDVPAG